MTSDRTIALQATPGCVILLFLAQRPGASERCRYAAGGGDVTIAYRRCLIQHEPDKWKGRFLNLMADRLFA